MRSVEDTSGVLVTDALGQPTGSWVTCEVSVESLKALTATAVALLLHTIYYNTTAAVCQGFMVLWF